MDKGEFTNRWKVEDSDVIDLIGAELNTLVQKRWGLNWNDKPDCDFTADLDSLIESECRKQREICAELHIKITVDLRESLIGGEHEREKILENYRKGNTYKEFLNAPSPIKRG